ncbi:MAG TPA: hypothetical protein VFE53_23695 [Mucilaginibacter sp.]|jgi:hypothetical protein|nr:hypothetical protein [Mucilaginibacter sp.]
MGKILALALVIINLGAFAQDSLKVFNNTRNETTATGMKVLGGWGLANVAAGATGWSVSNGGQNRYFYEMTTIWGSINFAIAIPAYLNAKRQIGVAFTSSGSLAAQQKIEKIFLVNGALDVVYIGAGFYLDSRGSNNNNAQLKGYGLSVALQGAFLLMFDATMYRSQRGRGNKLRHFLEKNPVTFTGRSIGIGLHI